MSTTITTFKIYQVKNKANSPSYVYMGKPYEDIDGKSFYPHIISEKCEDVYLFTTLVGSKNVRFTPSTLVPKLAEDNTEVLYDPFVHVDTRWYHFRYPGIENDVPENLPPNNFIKYHSGARGDYTVEWRKLTSSDGSVLIKPSLSSTVFWNGNTFISDSKAGYFGGTYDQNIIDDDLIYLKSRHYIEVVRNTIKSDSLSLIYKKYIDECKWKSTYLMKRFRGSHCISVKENENKTSVVVGIGETYPECLCGCVSCWEIVNGEAIKKYRTVYGAEGIIKLAEKWSDFKQYTSDVENNDPVTMTWIEQFDYNWMMNNMGYNLFGSFPSVVEDIKTVEIKFNKFSDRQNRFYGINSRTATREHHAMPPVKPTDENPHIYTYENTHSLFHPDSFIQNISGYSNRYATTPTKLITKGRIDDGKERVVVPPGAIFRTLKAVPGILSLYELDIAYRRPDEFHFAVDGYGNILGYKNLPFPGLVHTEYPVEDVEINPESRNDVYLRNKISDAWNCYIGNDKAGFCSEETIDDIHMFRVDNNYILFPKTYNPGSNPVETISGGATHTYVNVHHCPIWIDVDIFCSYYFVENPKKFTNPNDLNNSGCGQQLNVGGVGCLTSSSSSSTSISSSSSSSSSSDSDGDDDDKVTIIVEDDVETSASSSDGEGEEEPGFSTEPRPPIRYSDDLLIVNEAHGFVDKKVAGNYIFTVPSGVKKIKIMVWGAGAGGGGYAHMDVTNVDREHSLSKASGGGGGAGGHLRVNREVSEFTTYTMTVGAGGNTGASYTVEGKINSDMTTTWHDANKNVISEPSIIKAVDGGNGGDSIFGGNFRAYGGRSGVGATVQKANGLAGQGGVGSPGGTSYTVSGVTTYKGNNGTNGESIYEGPKGPALFGGSYGFAVSPAGGLCQIDGAGKGADGSRNHVDTSANGQDGRIRIEW